MLDHEKTIQGLECCWNIQQDNKTVKSRCRECPYYDGTNYPAHCHSALINDALAFIKDMQRGPKVITLEELYTLEQDRLVFLETKKTLRPAYTIRHHVWPEWTCRYEIDRHEYILMTPVSASKMWRFNLYGKTWRLWDMKPTDEQRKAVKWRAGNKDR